MTEKKRRIYIRADGNGQIGMGHVMRCLSVGMALRDEGGEVCFLLAGGEAAATVERAGFPCEVLGTDYRRMEEELPALEQLLSREKRRAPEAAGDGRMDEKNCLFLVDSYFVTERYLRMLGGLGRVAYMDDINTVPYPVDAVINGNIYGAGMDYSVWGIHTEILGGPAFAPLRPEYEAGRGERREEYILVTTGGGDPYCLAEKIACRLLKEPWMEQEKICVVCGSFSQSAGTLREMEKEDARLGILQNVPDMWNVMNGAKLAITAAGSTMQELACLGVPMIGFSFADNQRLAAQAWFKQGYSHYGGDYLSQGEEMLEEVCEAARQLCMSAPLRDRYSRKLMRLVDGEGSRRIAERLMNLLEERK